MHKQATLFTRNMTNVAAPEQMLISLWKTHVKEVLTNTSDIVQLLLTLI